MSEPHEEMLQIADRLARLAEQGNAPEISEPLEVLKNAANEVGKAFGGSWQGYHAHVYYASLKPPPPGARFSQEWGLMEAWPIHDTRGDWQEFDPEAVRNAIFEQAGNPDLEALQKFFDDAAHLFEADKSEALSILTTELADSADPFFERLKKEVEEQSVLSKSEVAEHLRPKRQIMTRDTVVLGQGSRLPPHMAVLSEVLALQHTTGVVVSLADLTRQAGSHLLRKGRRRRNADTVGINVFIGHGQSGAWRDLKDFVQDRLRLPWDEFNRVPVAGVTNIERLSEMLDSAAIALLVMTGEDEQNDGKLHARMNVVHEAGLFQGRLGFTRAIVVLEEGCEAFSNIEGLGQIRFPKGNIKAAFEEIRRVFEREGILAE